MKKERILVVDDDPQIQHLLRARLLALEFDVRMADCGEDAIITTAEFEPDIILMALCLQGIDGLETCRRLREWCRTPIIVLDSQDQEQLKVAALDTGADDYVVKPFSMAELLARMRAVLRRCREGLTATVQPTSLSFGSLTVDLVNRRVYLQDKRLHLTPTEYELLRVLATHAGRVLTHRELLTCVWGPESACDTQYLHVFVSQLRHKLEPRPEARRHILTEPGVGYQFAPDA